MTVSQPATRSTGANRDTSPRWAILAAVSAPKPSGGERIGVDKGLPGHRAPGDERDVGAPAQHEAAVQRQCRTVVFDLFARGTVEPGRLAKDDRGGAAHGREQHAIR